MPPPPTAKLPEEVYPAPNIKWFRPAEMSSSIFRGREDKGLQRPEVKVVQRPPAPAAATAAQKKLRFLVVHVLNASVFEPPRGASGGGESGPRYRATAYYQSEINSGAVESRMTASEAATVTGSREDCEFNQQIRLPFNAKEQFVKVALFREGLPTAALIGEATLPVAEPSIEETNTYSLLQDFEDQGEITLYVSFPEEDLPPPDTAPTSPEAAAAEQPPAEAPLPPLPPPQSPQTDGERSPARSSAGQLPRIAEHPPPPLPPPPSQQQAASSQSRGHPGGSGEPGIQVGDRFELYSQSAGTWVLATVIEIEADAAGKSTVIFQYGNRRRHLMPDSPEWGQLVRSPASGAEEATGAAPVSPQQGHADPLLADAGTEPALSSSPPYVRAAHLDRAAEPRRPGPDPQVPEQPPAADPEAAAAAAAAAAAVPPPPAPPPVFVAPPRYVGVIPDYHYRPSSGPGANLAYGGGQAFPPYSLPSGGASFPALQGAPTLTGFARADTHVVQQPSYVPGGAAPQYGVHGVQGVAGAHYPGASTVSAWQGTAALQGMSSAAGAVAGPYGVAGHVPAYGDGHYFGAAGPQAPVYMLPPRMG